jgi:hypothetical protein
VTRLTIVGGGREAWVVCGRGTQSILRARGRWLALVVRPLNFTVRRRNMPWNHTPTG